MEGHQRLLLQSKKWLLESLFELMKNEQYESISVKEIAEKAKLSRRTFYRAFKDKNDLLYFYIDNLTQEYLDSLELLKGRTLGSEKIFRYFFEFWWNRRDLVRLLIRQDLFHVVTRRMGQQSNQIYELFPAPWHIDGTENEIKYVLTFFSGGLWNVLEAWLNSDNPENYKDLSRTLLDSINKLGEYR